MSEDYINRTPASQSLSANHLHSEKTQTSAIFCLHEEILWSIFRMNANMDEDDSLSSNYRAALGIRHTPRALTVTRRSSQVCGLWRDIIVRTPSIWASLIDWALLRRLETDNWLEEVLRRSKEHLLFVKFDEWDTYWSQCEHFASFIDYHWDRIQRLSFAIHCISIPAAAAAGAIYDVLSRPTLCLQSLSFSLGVIEGRFFFLKARVLFSGHAPALRELSLHWANFKFQPQASTFSQIRSLAISFATHLDLSDIVKTLANTPLLECLMICDCHLIGYQNVEGYKSKIRLPKLSYVKVVDPQFGLCTLIADSIVLPAGCVVNWSCRFTWSERSRRALDPLHGDHSAILLKRSLKKICSTFGRIAEEFADWYSIQALNICLNSQAFAFRDTTSLPFPHIMSSSRGNLFVDVHEVMTCESLLALFQSVSTANISNVKQLALDLEPVLLGLSFEQFNFSRYFERMTSLEHVSFNPFRPGTINFLLSGCKDLDHDVFPNLKCLTYPHIGLMAHEELEALLSFLRWRKANGASIEILRLSFPYYLPVDLRCLDEFDGLQVVWSRKLDIEMGEEKVYVCGSGHKDDLLFREDK